MALNAKNKLKLLEWLDLFKAAGIAILLMLGILTLHKQSVQLQATNSQVAATKAVVEQIKQETADLKQDNHKDHDTIVKYLDCLANLFGTYPNQVITKDQFDACLAGTRVTPATISSKISNTPATTKSTPSTSAHKTPTTSAPPPSHKPAKILGISICIPFTNICVER